MKAKELADILMKNPELEIQPRFVEYDMYEGFYDKDPELYEYGIRDVCVEHNNILNEDVVVIRFMEV